MMNELNSLRDIHYPEIIGWWPWPLSWYLILAALLLTIFLSYLFFVAYRGRVLRRTKKQIREAYSSFLQHQDSRLLAAEINIALRTYVLYYFPAATVASITGDQWVKFLNEVVKEPVFSVTEDQPLAQGPYNPKLVYSEDELLANTTVWLKQHPRFKKENRFWNRALWFAGH
ncbi:MAG TPA: hypothetical protein DCZ03_02085 [Gammaproteobacteria bacterium]|nr:hypothetical protein [Gammaproteobacteria bacterium]